MARVTGERVTAADVARSLGLSRATVGFVLNDTPGQTISAATKKRVLDEARRLGYRPHAAARALASGRSRIVLMVLPDWPRDHSLQANLDEASAALDDAGYAFVTMTRRASGHARPLWETLAPDVVLGLLPFSEDERRAIHDSGVEHVISAEAGEAVPDAMRLGFVDGPRLQVEHLLDRGRTSIAFAGSPDPRIAGLVQQRRRDAGEAWSSRTGKRLDDAVVDLDAANVDEAVRGWAERGVDGVVAYNDDIAALVLGAALRQGIPVPEQLAIIGHDDSPIASLLVPALSSVRIDNAGLGRYIAAIALHAAEGAELPSPAPRSAATTVARQTT
jgi:DNA-binding LacI/PurR family transcriptional regulator